jgi:O-antigen/teichoic acid export membrane protein
MLGTDLYVRRELPQLADDAAGRAATTDVVGTSLAIVTVSGVALAILQISLALPLANAQGDAELRTFMVVLAIQPMTWNLAGVLAAALQSRHHLGALAVIRGLVTPLVLAIALFASWKGQLSVRATLVLLLATSVLALAMITVLYVRHFPLGATLRAALRPKQVRPALHYGLRLFLPLVFYTIGGKLDLYALGAYYRPEYVGMYAACLQMASLIPNIRGLFDPIVQAQIGGLYHTDRAALAASLRHLARLCAFALAPAFVITVAVGQPLLGWLVGAPVPQLFAPLMLLAVGHLVSWIAVASWIVPMMFAGRPMAIIALTAGLAKLGLLLVLVPRYGAIGAAIATSAGAIIALHGQTLVGARAVPFQPFPSSILPVLVVTLIVAAGGRGLFELVAPHTRELWAVMIAGGGALVVLGGGLLLLMTGADRVELRRLLGLRVTV